MRRVALVSVVLGLIACEQHEPLAARPLAHASPTIATYEHQTEHQTEHQAGELVLTEDTILDRPLRPADASEHVWSMPTLEPGPLPRWLRHTPIPGETIEQLALRYGVQARSIRDWNRLGSDEQPTFVRGRAKSLRIYAQRYAPPRELLEHRVRADEGWLTIARDHGVDSSELRLWNVGEVGRELEPGERLSVWIDPLVYHSIVADELGPYDEATRARLAAVRPGAHARGTPQDGVLVSGVQIPEGPNYELRFPSSSWGTTFAVRQTLVALARFAELGDYPLPIKLGSMSRQRGGPIGGHESHQSGRDLDIRLPLRTSVPQGLPPSSRRIDWQATYELVRAFSEREGVTLIFLDSKAERRMHKAALAAGVGEDEIAEVRAKVRHEPGHEHHIHVRFACGPAEPECAD